MFEGRPRSTLFPYTTLFRSRRAPIQRAGERVGERCTIREPRARILGQAAVDRMVRSEEHTSELQSHSDLVCRLLLEIKKTCSWQVSSLRYKTARIRESLTGN